MRTVAAAATTMLLTGCVLGPHRPQSMYDTPEPWPPGRTIAHQGEAAEHDKPRGAFNRPLADGIDPFALIAAIAGKLPPPPIKSPGVPEGYTPVSAEELLSLTDDAIRVRPKDAGLYESRARFLDILGRHREAAADRARADALRSTATPPGPPPPPVEP